MKTKKRRYFTQSDKTLMWDRWPYSFTAICRPQRQSEYGACKECTQYLDV
jgi:hypothetical protein